MHRYRLDKHGGQICVVETGNMHDKPEAVESWWPTGRPSVDFTDDERAAAMIIKGGYGYTFRVPGIGYWIDCPMHGDTRPVNVEILPIPRPKVRRGIETRYRDGQWQKRLKSRGWVPA